MRLHGRSGVQVEAYGGRTRLEARLRAITNQDDFQTNCRWLGIVRDADASEDAAFRSICRSLSNVGQPTPAHLNQEAVGVRRVRIIVLSGGGRTGELEDLVWEAFEEQEIAGAQCVVDFLGCMKSEGWVSTKPAKSRIYSFLSALTPPDRSLGAAALDDVAPIPLRSALFAPLLALVPSDPSVPIIWLPQYRCWPCPIPTNAVSFAVGNETHSQLRTMAMVEQRARTTEAVERGYRQTAQRAVILDVVKGAEAHLTAGEIFERVRRRDPRDRLRHRLPLAAPAGRARADPGADLRRPGQPLRRPGRSPRPRPLHCAAGLLVDVDVPVALIARHVAEERSGFAITSHHTVFAGTCPACRRGRRQAAAATAARVDVVLVAERLRSLSPGFQPGRRRLGSTAGQRTRREQTVLMSRCTDVRDRESARLHRGQGDPQGRQPDDQPGRDPRADGAERLRQEHARLRHRRPPGLRGHRGLDPLQRRGHPRAGRRTSAPSKGIFLAFQYPTVDPRRLDGQLPAHGGHQRPQRARRGAETAATPEAHARASSAA